MARPPRRRCRALAALVRPVPASASANHGTSSGAGSTTSSADRPHPCCRRQCSRLLGCHSHTRCRCRARPRATHRTLVPVQGPQALACSHIPDEQLAFRAARCQKSTVLRKVDAVKAAGVTSHWALGFHDYRSVAKFCANAWRLAVVASHGAYARTISP